MRGFIFFLLLIGLVLPLSSWAQGWTAHLSAHNYLPSFFAVDKSLQQAYLVNSQDPDHPLSPWWTLICSTGQKDGDKVKKGDLKTPEGVYFIVDKINSGLDFFEYGNTAFPLNYPNPVDRVRNKTGSGIWIHGRGIPLTPKMTRGCISLHNAEVDHLDDHVFLHTTPIIISQNLVWSNATPSRAVAEIAAGTRAWAQAWNQGKNSLTRLYDPQLFLLSSGQHVDTYLQQELDQKKEHSAWIDLRVRDLHIVEGPEYMVSAFIQHTMPMDVSGYRRLYWMQKEKHWVIVGEEWVPQGQDSQDVYMPSYKEMVEQEIQDTLRQAEQWWAEKKLHHIMRIYAQGAVRGADTGKKAITQRLQQEMAATANPFAGAMTLEITAQGIVVLQTKEEGPARKFLFHPGPHNTWKILAEDVEL